MDERTTTTRVTFKRVGLKDRERGHARWVGVLPDGEEVRVYMIGDSDPEWFARWFRGGTWTGKASHDCFSRAEVAEALLSYGIEPVFSAKGTAPLPEPYEVENAPVRDAAEPRGDRTHQAEKSREERSSTPEMSDRFDPNSPDLPDPLLLVPVVVSRLGDGTLSRRDARTFRDLASSLHIACSQAGDERGARIWLLVARKADLALTRALERECEEIDPLTIDLGYQVERDYDDELRGFGFSLGS